MGLFRRSQPSSERVSHPVSAFWSWWEARGHRVDPHRISPLTDELAELVASIHPELVWEFGKGVDSEHRLTVSAGGVAAVRPAAERWLRAAPAPTETWEFRSSKEADPAGAGQTLEIAGARINLAETTFRVESSPEELRVHIGVFHPRFPDLSDQVRGQVSYLLLDWLLGEDDVERWLGHIEPLVVPPGLGGTAQDVVSAVDQIRSQRDINEWTLARFADEKGRPGMALFRRGLRWLDHPTLDRHQLVTARYRAQPDGLPADDAAFEELQAMEEELESVAGTRGVLVGHESHCGSRRFHVYTDGEDQNVDADLRRWAQQRRVSLQATADPAWSHVRHMTG
ncbi:DUF695 domain-containing protein [Nocardioides humilatus]|uniref:DUF695 domain-containing protein n=1 Tax=Nocardioides humilatus TaxID=2607660 RepID=A0A5B1LAI0_9ACTN|nr:DUF695 domain-containing protein [Nocardioides humilatus]KAA1417743.1 DUF695 domain-containing protein [Nocardioides humilatus]